MLITAVFPLNFLWIVKLCDEPSGSLLEKEIDHSMISVEYRIAADHRHIEWKEKFLRVVLGEKRAC